MPLIIPANTLSGDYEIDNSLRFNSGDSPELTKTFGTANGDTWSYSCWLKRGDISEQGHGLFKANTSAGLYFLSTGALVVNDDGASAHTSTELFRDVSAWYHIVFTGNGTLNKVYVNNSLLTLSGADPNIGDINNNVAHSISKSPAGVEYMDGYLSEIHFVDGSALTPSSFAETDDNGIWVPKEYTGSYGDNGFYLQFKQTGTSADASGIGADTSGNTNHFAVSNLAATDITTDTPQNNFATLNPLYLNRNIDSGYVYSEGNTRIAWTSNNDDKSLATSTIGVTSGKWYFEAKTIDVSRGIIGVGDMTQMAQFTDAFYDNDPSYGMGVYLPNGNLQENNTSAADWSSDVSDNDICMLALDMDNHRCWFGINGTWQDSGDPTSGSTGTGDMTTQISDQSHINTGEFIFPFFGDVSTSEKTDISVNFGNPSFSISSGNADANGYGNFEYAPPSGFYALCSKNLAEFG